MLNELISKWMMCMGGGDGYIYLNVYLEFNKR